MKKISDELDDWLRPEYDRSELGELVRGKYAVTQVEFAQLVKLTLACIGEDEGLHIEHHSRGNHRAGHKAGDWTYEIDNANQITLRYWLTEFRSVEEPVSNQAVIRNSQELFELQNSLRIHFGILRAHVGNPKDKVNLDD